LVFRKVDRGRSEALTINFVGAFFVDQVRIFDYDEDATYLVIE